VRFLLVVLALRLLYLAQLHASPLGGFLLGDLRVYHERARQILAGDLVGGAPPFYGSTLYPYILAAIYALAGARPAAAQMVQVLLGTLACYLIWRLGAEIFDARRALVAAVIAGLYGPFVFAEGQILMISWSVFAVVAALLAAARYARTGRAGTALLCGLACGLGAADKPNLMLLAATIPFGWWFAARPAAGPSPAPATPSAGMERSGAGTLLRGVSALGAGIAAVLLPVMARNVVATQGDFLISASSGVNMAIGNGPRSDGTFREPWSDRAHETLRLYDLGEASVHFASQALGRPLTAKQADDYWRGEASTYVRQHPLGAFRLLGRKLLLLVNHAEIPNVLDFEFFRSRFAALRMFPAGFWLVGPLGLVGAALAIARRDRRTMAPALFLVLYGASVALLFVCDRFRLPAAPVLILFAADALVALYDAVREGRWLLVRPLMAGLVPLAVIIGLPLVHYNHGRDHWMVAQALEAEGQPEAAVAEYRAALAEDPSMGEVWNNQARLLIRLGRYPEAEESLRQAVGAAPGLAYPHQGLADLMRLKALADRQHARGSIDEAMQEYRRALEIDPSLVDAWLSLARLHYDRGETALARALLLKGKSLNSGVLRFDEILREIGDASGAPPSRVRR